MKIIMLLLKDDSLIGSTDKSNFINLKILQVFNDLK